MAVKGEVQFWDKDGTQLEGPRANQNSVFHEFHHEVYVPMDKEDNSIKGSRRIGEFSVIKEMDKLSPQLMQILCMGELCKKILVTLYRIAETGDEEPYFEFEFEEAKLVNVHHTMPSTKTAEREHVGHLEKISFIAKHIHWSYLEGGISYTDEAF
jgi:type VI secretion system secreted protein Hcp